MLVKMLNGSREPFVSDGGEGEGIGLGQNLNPSRDTNDGRIRLLFGASVITMTGSHFASHHPAP